VEIEKIGEGSYGEVFKAIDSRTQEVVAIKRIRTHSKTEGLSGYTMRELDLLQKFAHPCIVRVKAIVFLPKYANIVMEYLPYTLHDIIRDFRKAKTLLPLSYTRQLLYQLLCGVAMMHSKSVIHRDLKPENLLLSEDQTRIKIADLGFARTIGPCPQSYTAEVCTLWYRAPEILLTNGFYGKPSDVWAIGCIFAELLTLVPIFSGHSELDQLNIIFQRLGNPTQQSWPGFSRVLEESVNVPQNGQTGYRLVNFVKGNSPGDAGVDLLYRMLALDPGARITPIQALQHPYFNGFEMSG
jgi:serine/threonine protein kinase